MATRDLEPGEALYLEKLRSSKGIGVMLLAMLSLVLVFAIALAIASRIPPLLRRPGAETTESR